MGSFFTTSCCSPFLLLLHFQMPPVNSSPHFKLWNQLQIHLLYSKSSHKTPVTQFRHELKTNALLTAPPPPLPPACYVRGPFPPMATKFHGNYDIWQPKHFNISLLLLAGHLRSPAGWGTGLEALAEAVIRAPEGPQHGRLSRRFPRSTAGKPGGNASRPWPRPGSVRPQRRGPAGRALPARGPGWAGLGRAGRRLRPAAGAPAPAQAAPLAALTLAVLEHLEGRWQQRRLRLGPSLPFPPQGECGKGRLAGLRAGAGRGELVPRVAGSPGWAPPPPRAARSGRGRRRGRRACGATAGPVQGEISEAQDGICPSFCLVFPLPP